MEHGLKTFVRIVVEGYLNCYVQSNETNTDGLRSYMSYIILQRTDEEEQFWYDTWSTTFDGFRKRILDYLSDAPELCEKIKNGTYGRGNFKIIAEEYNSLHSKKN